MAEEVRGSVTGGNGERLEVKFGQRSFGLQVRDILPVLFLLLAAGGGYLAYASIQDFLSDMRTRQVRILEEMIRDKEQRMEDLGGKLMEGLNQQNRLLTEQTQTLIAHVDHQTEVLKHLLVVHESNEGKAPSDRLPLEPDPHLLRPPHR